MTLGSGKITNRQCLQRETRERFGEARLISRAARLLFDRLQLGRLAAKTPGRAVGAELHEAHRIGRARPCFFHEPMGDAREGLAALRAAPGYRRRLRAIRAANPVCARCVCPKHLGARP